MIYVNDVYGDGLGIGLGKPKKKKLFRKVNLKQVSIKNVKKVAKFAAPIAAGFIPVGGGVVSKVLNSKIGKKALQIKNTVSKAKKTTVGSAIFSKLKKKRTLSIGSKGEDVRELQEQLGVEPDGDFGPKTQQALEQATGQRTISNEAVAQTSEPMNLMQAQSRNAPVSYDEMPEGMDVQPQGKTMPVRPFEEFPENMGANPQSGSFQTSKNNTLLYVGGAVVLAGVVYLATKKSN